MPTYTYACNECGATADVWQTIGQYVRAPEVPQHCGHPMARRITSAAPVFVSEAHYEGLRASDGTDISTRAKHRAYMRERNLTTMDDFKEQWRRDAQARADAREANDATRKQDIAEAMRKVENRG